MSRRFSLGLVACLFTLACGSGKPGPAESAAEEKASGSEESSEGEATSASSGEGEKSSGGAVALPEKCSGSGDVCTPDPGFVKRLCSGNYPGVALYMFAKTTPWTRGYLTRKTEAWNAAGGASDTDMLDFDEEVIVLVQRKAGAGQIQVGSGVGYETLRWNGSCATLQGEELTLKAPPQPKTAKVEFKQLDEPLKEALREDTTINEAYLSRRKECQAASMGTVSLKCVKADAKLSESIVQYVRGGGTVPKPSKLPE
jgi:hypothetical protein